VLRAQNRVRLFEQVPSPDNSSPVVALMLTAHYIEDVLSAVPPEEQKKEEIIDDAGHTFTGQHKGSNISDEVDCTISTNTPRKRSRVASEPVDACDDPAIVSSALMKFSKWLLTHRNVSVLEKDLVRPFPAAQCNIGEEEEQEGTEEQQDEEGQSKVLMQITPEEVQALRRCGFLQERVGSVGQAMSSTKSSGTLFSLSHPGGGRLAIALSSAQSLLLQRMRMTKYKEITEKKLIAEIRAEHSNALKTKPEMRNVECSRKFPLGLRYHLYDMLGRQVLTRVTAPSLSISAAGAFDGILRLGPTAVSRGGTR